MKKCLNVKELIQKHFSFVSSTINCLSSDDSICDKLDSICKSSDNLLNVFMASLLQISINIKSSISTSSSMLFDSIVGYNPYSFSCSTYTQLYSLNDTERKTIENECLVQLKDTQMNTDTTCELSTNLL